MATVVSGNSVEEEYMWSCSLDKDNKEFMWMPEEPVKGPDANNEDEKEDLKPGHRLLIKNAILMPDAEKDAVHVVQIDCEGYNSKKVSVPVVTMRGQVDYQRYVDLLVPCPAKIRLVSGDGPLHLTGSHCVDYYGYRGQGECEVEESEEEDVDMKENGGGKEDLRNKLKEKERMKNEAKEIGIKSKTGKEDKDEKGGSNELETEKEGEKKDESVSKKRKASEDPTPEKEKKIKTGSAEKKEKLKSK